MPQTASERPCFPSRDQAGRQLASRVLALQLPPPLLVLALPRGGVPVAAPVARALGAPIDLAMVRKIGLPGRPEVALAAVVDGDHPEVVVDAALQAAFMVERDYLEAQTLAALRELARRHAVYLQGRAPLPLAGRTVVVVDDGIATGTRVRAVLKAVRRGGAACVVLAVPLAPAELAADLRGQVDHLVCLSQPSPFSAVGAYYADFHPVSDDEVLQALERAETPAGDAG